uniref:Uncharacterized protein n=1 Tax=Anguilla anguilla TaxID=7936 RepID=A0A0E9PRU7_ANGAN
MIITTFLFIFISLDYHLCNSNSLTSCETLQ